MILDKYIRYYYNMHGAFDKTMRYYDLIEQRAENEGMQVNAYLYSRLGYNHTVDLPADAVARIRQLACRKETDNLYSLFNIKTRQELNSVLSTIGAMPDYIKKVNAETSTLDDIASAIANYMKNVTHVRLSNGVSLAQYILMMHHVSDNEKLQSLIESEAFRQLVEAAMPKFSIRKNCSPYVTGGTCFVPYKLNSKDTTYINLAIRKYLCRPVFLNKSEFVFCNNACLTIEDLYETDVYSYLKLIDIANAQDITVNELINNLGYRITNFDKQLEDDKIIYYLSGNDSVKVYTMQSIKTSHFVILSFVEFKELYEKDILRFISWDENDNIALLNEQQARIYKSAMEYSRVDNDLLVKKVNDKQLELISSFGG